MRALLLSFLLPLCFVLSLLFVVPLAAQAADPTGLVPCDGISVRCQACSVIKLANNIITWLIGIMTVLCGIVVAVAGLKMVMSGGDSHARQEAHEMMTNVIVGFFIILSAWLIIDTIMKTFVNENATAFGPWNQISCVAAPAVRTPATPSTPATPNTPATPPSSPATPNGGTCTNCSAIPSGITVKSGACGGGGACTISPDIAGSLSTMDTSLDAAGINWRVTEAYPPSRVHKDACHQNGTCIDANCIGGCSAAQVKTFVNSATNAGLRAVYEVKTQAEKDALVSSGVSASNVEVLWNWISGSHFSVYKGK